MVQFWTILGVIIALLVGSTTITITLFLRLNTKIDSVATKLDTKIDTKIDSVATELRQEIHGQAIRIDQVLLAVGDLRSDMGKLQGDIKIIQNHLGLSQTA